MPWKNAPTHTPSHSIGRLWSWTSQKNTGAHTTRMIAGTSIAFLRPMRSDHAPPPIMPTNWNSDANVTARMMSPRGKSKYVVAYAMTKTVYT